MTLEEIKNVLCINKELIEKLSHEYQQTKIKLKELTEKIKDTHEYKQYINDTSSEDKRQRLINTPIYTTFLKLKDNFDSIDEKIKDEQNKCTEEDFELAKTQTLCNHIFYRVGEGKKVCIKCGRVIGESKEEHKSIKEFRLSLLYIELSEYYKTITKEYDNVTEFLQNETLEHIVNETKEILNSHPNIDNERLQQILEKRISQKNIELIEDMYESDEKMNSELKENYNTYKKNAGK